MGFKRNKERAGGIILDHSGEYILLIHGNEPTNKWNLPKGSLKKNESIESAAIREIHEETGILFQSSNLNYFIKTKYADFFGLTVDINHRLCPIDREIIKIQWFPIKNLQRMKNNHETSSQLNMIISKINKFSKSI